MHYITAALFKVKCFSSLLNFCATAIASSLHVNLLWLVAGKHIAACQAGGVSSENHLGMRRHVYKAGWKTLARKWTMPMGLWLDKEELPDLICRNLEQKNPEHEISKRKKGPK